MQQGKLQFRHRWGLTLLATVLVFLGLSLGSWQLQRAEDKQQRLDIQNTNKRAETTELQPSHVDLQQMRFKTVNVHGQYDFSMQILLENQKYKGQPGYFVITPMRLQGSQSVVLINRGWIAQGVDRQQLPVIPASPAGNLTGIVDAFPAVGMKLGEPGDAQANWPRQLTYLDLGWLSRETGYNLLPYLVYQTSEVDDGLIRDWQQNFEAGQRMTPDKHRGYALQWYSLVVLTIVMYFVLSFKRKTPIQGNEKQHD